MKLTITGLIFASTIALSAMTATDLADRGLEIAEKADQADNGFGDSKVSLTMLLTNKQGQESKRFLETYTLEQANDGDKSMVIFNNPKDIAGTATLTFTHRTGSDDQWLYLPALKRVKRISSDNKSGPFMGSEFAYEDLSSQEVEKYTYKFVKEESLNGTATYVVERDPVDEKSGYTKQVVWYNKTNYRIEKIDFYDRKNAKLKTLTYSNYKQYLGKYWRAGELYMVNYQTGKKTKLLFENYQFKTGLTDDDFTQNSLQRAGK